MYDICEDALKSTGQFGSMHQYDARAFVSITMIPAPWVRFGPVVASLGFPYYRFIYIRHYY